MFGISLNNHTWSWTWPHLTARLLELVWNFATSRTCRATHGKCVASLPPSACVATPSKYLVTPWSENLPLIDNVWHLPGRLASWPVQRLAMFGVFHSRTEHVCQHPEGLFPWLNMCGDYLNMFHFMGMMSDVWLLLPETSGSYLKSLATPCQKKFVGRFLKSLSARWNVWQLPSSLTSYWTETSCKVW